MRGKWDYSLEQAKFFRWITVLLLCRDITLRSNTLYILVAYSIHISPCAAVIWLSCRWVPGNIACGSSNL
jgi:hypothetical protein